MEKGIKKRFVFDTSALISLGTGNLIGEVLRITEIITTDSVVKELIEFSRYGDRYGLVSREILKLKGKLNILKPSLKVKIRYLQETDNELYNLAKAGSLALITDDVKFFRHVNGKVDAEFSTFFLAALLGAGILSKEKALELLEKMRDARNWRNNIILADNNF